MPLRQANRLFVTLFQMWEVQILGTNTAELRNPGLGTSEFTADILIVDRFNGVPVRVVRISADAAPAHSTCIFCTWQALPSGIMDAISFIQTNVINLNSASITFRGVGLLGVTRCQSLNCIVLWIYRPPADFRSTVRFYEFR